MTTAPGWYADPNGDTRFWDGVAWTSQVQGISEPVPPGGAHPVIVLPSEGQTSAYAPEADPFGQVSAAGVQAADYGIAPLPDPYAAPTPPAYGAVAPYAAPPAYGAVQPYAAAAPSASPMAPYGAMPGQVAGLPTPGISVAGFIVGLVSIFMPLFIGIIVAIIGLVLSIVGASRPFTKKGLAIAGIILSSVGLILIL